MLNVWQRPELFSYTRRYILPVPISKPISVPLKYGKILYGIKYRIGLLSSLTRGLYVHGSNFYFLQRKFRRTVNQIFPSYLMKIALKF